MLGLCRLEGVIGTHTWGTVGRPCPGMGTSGLDLPRLDMPHRAVAYGGTKEALHGRRGLAYRMCLYFGGCGGLQLVYVPRERPLYSRTKANYCNLFASSFRYSPDQCLRFFPKDCFDARTLPIWAMDVRSEMDDRTACGNLMCDIAAACIAAQRPSYD